MSKVAMPLVHKALKKAVKAHKKQEREGEFPLPYVTHPVEVVSLLRYEGGVWDEEVLAAAILHDVIEECALSEKNLKKAFGERVADLVHQLTRHEPDRGDMDEEAFQRARFEALLAGVDAMGLEAKMVKLADRISNLRAALCTRSGEDLAKYVDMSRQIRDHIPRETSPVLWDRLNSLAEQAGIVQPKEGKPPRRKVVAVPSTTP